MAELRCPAITAADMRALDQQLAPPPEGDLKRAAAEEWIDLRAAQFYTVRLAGKRIARQYDRCRRGKPVS